MLTLEPELVIPRRGGDGGWAREALPACQHDWVQVGELDLGGRPHHELVCATCDAVDYVPLRANVARRR